MNEFKKGDIIRGLKNNGYTITNEHMIKAKVVEVIKMCNQMKIVILEHDTRQDNLKRKYTVANDGGRFELWKEHNETIVIYRKDNKVIALDKRDGRTATARCCPDDTFCFDVGAKLAFNRLIGKDEYDPKPLYYNGKVVCVEFHSMFGRTDFTPGKIYEVKNGKINGDKLEFPLYNYRFRTFEDLQIYFKRSGKFIEVVE